MAAKKSAKKNGTVDLHALLNGIVIEETSVKITNSGDGLSKALAVDPPNVRHRDTVHVVLECVVADMQTPIIKDSDGNELKMVLRAGRASIVDADLVAEVLDEQDRRIEEAAGIQRIPGMDGASE